jgi:two-component system, chemotaxis family, protein-glutamate methylesterase/glutaminase
MTSLEKTKLRVLIVDDSFLMRSTIRKILEVDKLVTEIQEAHDGQQALNMVKVNDFDVVLLDIEMPIMDGIEFMKRARIHTDATVIIISSLAQVQSTQVEKAIFFGAQDVVAKPTGIMATGFDSAKKSEIIDAIHRSAHAAVH